MALGGHLILALKGTELVPRFLDVEQSGLRLSLQRPYAVGKPNQDVALHRPVDRYLRLKTAC
ncbi:MAG: hypothetical protein QM765_37560 [Myxococcales bacterium]